MELRGQFEVRKARTVFAEHAGVSPEWLADAVVDLAA